MKSLAMFAVKLMESSVPLTFSTGQVGPMNVMKFGRSGTPRPGAINRYIMQSRRVYLPRYDSGQIFHLSAKFTPFFPTIGNRGRYVTSNPANNNGWLVVSVLTITI